MGLHSGQRTTGGETIGIAVKIVKKNKISLTMKGTEHNVLSGESDGLPQLQKRKAPVYTSRGEVVWQENGQNKKRKRQGVGFTRKCPYESRLKNTARGEDVGRNRLHEDRM